MARKRHMVRAHRKDVKPGPGKKMKVVKAHYAKNPRHHRR